MRRRRGKDISTSFLELEFDAAVRQGLLADLHAPKARFSANLFHGVRLHEAMQLSQVAPGATVIVKLDGAADRVDDGWIFPAGLLHQQTTHLAAEEFGGPGGGFGQAQPATGGLHGGEVANLGKDADDVRHGDVAPFVWFGN
jgi:hypothetical protein